MGPALRLLLSGGDPPEGLLGNLWPRLRTLDRGLMLWTFAGVIVALGVVKGVGYLGQFYGMGTFGQRVAMDVRRALFAKLCGFSPSQRAQALSGDLLSRFVTDAAAVEVAATYALASVVRDSLQIVILTGVALSLSWRFTLGALVLIPLTVLPARSLSRRFLRWASEGQRGMGQLVGQIQEGISGVKVIQAFGAQELEQRRFVEKSQGLRRIFVRAGWLRGALPALMEILAAAGIAAVLAYATATSSIAPDVLVSLIATLVLIYQPAKDLGKVSQFSLQAAIAGQRIFEILDVPSSSPRQNGGRTLGPLRESIELRDLCFSYADKPALRGVTMTLPVGKVIACVGPSGSGKSTLTSLLLGFETPQQGVIRFDGVDARELSVESIRSQFSLVTQDPLLFSGTVLDNLRYARPSATLDEVKAAARTANASGFIEAMPQGYETPVGEKGVVLSGGQKQRLCLARALLANAPVLVLDEATSNLDPEGEKEVQAAIARSVEGRTVLLIAHRLQSVVLADAIHVLETGLVVQSGTHETLISAPGPYARLWALTQAVPDHSRGAA
jgi:subfamily B ATP-binding cassette protein MsbA